MSIDYKAAKKSFTKQKSALTRAKNSGDPQKVIDAVDAAFAEWDAMEIPFPDSWHLWKCAKEDAQFKLRWAEAGL